MKNHDSSAMSPERRHFLKQTAGAGMLVGVGPLLINCGERSASAGAKTEARNYFFDLSNADPEADYFLVAGSNHHPLSRATAAQIAQAQAAEPGLQQIGSQSLTHIGEALQLPTRIQMCYVKGVAKGRAPGEWTMHTMFYHVPTATAAAAGIQVAQSCGKTGPSSLKAAFNACLNDILTGISGQALAQNNSFCVGPQYDNFKDYFDHAVALVCHHPEVGSFDGPTLSYVQQNIVCTDINLLNLAVSLYEQGPASTTPGGWATLVEYIDPDTGLQKFASNGDKLYFTQHSATTLQLTGAAINSVLPKVKNDPLLGANITGLSKADLNTGLQGKMWVTKNGTPTRLPAAASSQSLRSRLLLAAGDAGPTWTPSDVSAGRGFSIDSVTGDAARTVTFSVSNWYLRYLGLYVRYLDAAKNVIPLSSLDSATNLQFIPSLSGTYDGFLAVVNQELVILGIPVMMATQSFSVTVPSAAASVQIMAGGLGSGTNTYPETVTPGAVMTVVIDLAIPGLFLAMAAAQGYASLSTTLATSTKLLISTAQAFLLAVTDAAVGGTYHDASVFKNLIIPIASTLLKSAIALNAEVTASLTVGGAEGVADDAMPFGIGLLVQAVMAAGTAASIIETSAEVANAPWTFVTQIDATHDLTVTINHDPADTQGFPATATYYKLTAVCDSGSPTESGRISMPTTTQTAPLTYTFRGIPSGGMVTVTTAFYSADDWLAGAGSTGAVDNTLDAASITIKENLVPLSAATVYTHKQKLGLDGSGDHIWIAGQQPTVQQAQCNNVSGNLCNLVGITVSEPFGAVGYVWQSFSSGVSSFGTGATGQLYQFANVSFTQNPQRGYLFSGGGFPSPPRMSYNRASPTSQNYYVDTSTGNAIVRRITMTAVDSPPTFDSPGSNRAVGSFNFLPDAFLIHPTGKLISINSALSKLEVLVPSATPVADASAPLAQAFAGPGSRDGLMNGPVCAVVAPGGAILVLEQINNRIQAFDTGANPTLFFAGSSTMPLKAQTGNVVYLDMAIEFVGYIYVLSQNTGTGLYSMDIYTPTGQLLATTNNMNASKLAIDLFRNVFTLNFETIQPVGDLTEPSISQWIPST